MEPRLEARRGDKASRRQIGIAQDEEEIVFERLVEVEMLCVQGGRFAYIQRLHGRVGARACRCAWNDAEKTGEEERESHRNRFAETQICCTCIESALHRLDHKAPNTD